MDPRCDRLEQGDQIEQGEGVRRDGEGLDESGVGPCVGSVLGAQGDLAGERFGMEGEVDRAGLAESAFDGTEQAGDFHLEGGFLEGFAAGPFDRGFAGIEFAAGQFPLVGMAAGRGALHEKDAVGGVPDEDADGDAEPEAGGGRGRRGEVWGCGRGRGHGEYYRLARTIWNPAVARAVGKVFTALRSYSLVPSSNCSHGTMLGWSNCWLSRAP
jgi:hypothetical protein